MERLWARSEERVLPADADWVIEAVRRFEKPLLVYVGRMLGGDERARDVVQEAFLQLCKCDRAEVEPKMPAWLFAVCRNRARDLLRKEKRMSALDEAVLDARPAETNHAPDPACVAEAKETGDRVFALLAALPPRSQEVVRLKFEHQLSYKEIGEVTGLSVGNVGFILHTALAKLRGLLEAPGAAAC
jgi:RNA polymerase sigma-70 factor (ECF subfamily)